MTIIKKIVDKYRQYVSPIKYARRIGVQIGDNCRLFGNPNWGSEPWLISIGNHTAISFECAFITHDGSVWVFREDELYKNTVKFGRIRVGNNCFIGARSTILPGVSIGDNSIIAAGAVVSKSVPAGEVWGGVPARRICSTSEYAEKCRKNTPCYNLENFKKNFADEVKHICDMREQQSNHFKE